MQDIVVMKGTLRAKLEENRAAHQAIFEEAVEGYRVESIRLLEDHILRIKEGKVLRISVALPMPENHTADYDRVIAMLEMHIENEIVLTEDDFSMYVMDQWRWRDAFLTQNSAYSATAARLSQT